MCRQYFRAEEHGISKEVVEEVVSALKKKIMGNTKRLIDVLQEIEYEFKLVEGDGPNFLYYLVTQQQININLTERISLNNLEITFLKR